jgi:branched-subunit amino acid ABC-type transport system permease component
MALARCGDRAQTSAIGTADEGAAEIASDQHPEVSPTMKRLMLFMPVLIVAIALFAFASRTEQGAMIRADVRKRVTQAIDSAKEMGPDGQDVVVEVETVTI